MSSKKTLGDPNFGISQINNTQGEKIYGRHQVNGSMEINQNFDNIGEDDPYKEKEIRCMSRDATRPKGKNNNLHENLNKQFNSRQ